MNRYLTIQYLPDSFAEAYRKSRKKAIQTNFFSSKYFKKYLRLGEDYWRSVLDDVASSIQQSLASFFLERRRRRMDGGSSGAGEDY